MEQHTTSPEANMQLLFGVDSGSPSPTSTRNHGLNQEAARLRAYSGTAAIGAAFRYNRA